MTPDPSVIAFLPWFIPAAIAGLIIWVDRREPVPCPPACRTCGYNLSGRAPDSVRCSECGAELSVENAIITSRPKRLALSSLIGFLLLLCMSVGGIIALACRFEWTKWYLTTAPNHLIAWHARQQVSPFETLALNQWFDRCRAKTLSSAEEAAMFDDLLTWQADRSRALPPTFGDFLQEMMNANRLSPAQSQKCVQGFFGDVKFVARSTIRVGDPVPCSFRFANPRGQFFLHGYGWYASFQEPPAGPPPNEWSRDCYNLPSSCFEHELPEALAADKLNTAALAPGVHMLHVLVAIKMNAGPAVAYRSSINIQVLPAGTAPGTPVFDPNSADAVAKSVQIAIVHSMDGQLDVDVRLGPAGVDRAFNVYIEHNDQRHFIGGCRAKAGTSDFHSRVATGYPRIESAQKIKSLKVILVSCPDLLLIAPDQYKYWEGTITFPDVPVYDDWASASSNQTARRYLVTPTTQPSSRGP